MAGLSILLIGVVLLRPGGRTLGDDTEHVERTTVLPFLSSGQSIVQRFTAQSDGLSQVMIRFAVGDGVDSCRVRALVTDASEVVAQRAADCADLRQAALWTIDFAPIEGSGGNTLELEVSLLGTSSAPMSLWGGPSVGRLPPAEIDKEVLPVSAELHTAYGDDTFAVQQLRTALDRIDGYGPFWHHPVAVTTVAVLTIVCLVLLASNPRRLGLALVVTFAVVKGILWSTVIPPMEGPDEKAHVAYAQFMAEQQRIPKRGTDQFGIDRTYSEQLDRGVRDVYHQTSSWPGNRADFSSESRARADRMLVGAGRDSGGDGAAAGYSPYYYAPAALLYLSAPTDLDVGLGVMRLWSVALGAAAAWLAVLIGRRLFPGSEAAALALGIAVAAQPMLSQQLAIVNNDGLIVVAGFACLLIALDLATPNAHHRSLVLGGLALGIAVATKPFGVAWAPVLVAGWLIGRLRTPPQERRRWIGDAVRAGAGVGATYGTWVAMSVALGLPPTTVQTFDPEPGPKTVAGFLDLHLEDGFKPLRDRWVQQFWGDFGGLTLPLPDWVLAGITVAAALTVLGLAAWAVQVAARVGRRRLRSIDDAELSSIVRVGLCVLAIVATLGVLHAADFLQYRRNGRLELVQGRYALMVLPAALATPVLLAKSFAPRLRLAPALAAIAVAVVGLNVLGLTLVVERYYL
ncbi:MAG: DUF2142 domain-containing protein [Acidimicrobiales bacterium]